MLITKFVNDAGDLVMYVEADGKVKRLVSKLSDIEQYGVRRDSPPSFQDLLAYSCDHPVMMRKVILQANTELRNRAARIQMKTEDQVAQVQKRRIAPGKKEKEVWLIRAYASAMQKPLIDEIQKNDRLLSFLRQPKNERKDIDLTQIKAIPVTNFVKFNRAGYAPCIWHNEKTPSMYYYKKDNSVYCFGCHRHGSVIDVVMELMGIDFKEAITKLQNGER